MKTPFLWVAFDELGLPDSPIDDNLLRKMWKVPGPWAPKINLDMMLERGCTESLKLLPDYGKSSRRPRFGDGKTHNGTRTMLRIVDVAHAAGFTHWNFHLEGCDNLAPAVERAKSLGLTTMGLTLFSHSQKPPVERIRELVKKAEQFGMDYVIIPASAASQITTNLDVLGTGWRVDGPDEHQPHALHPRAARGLVQSVAIGSPITKAKDPEAALKQHLAWLAGE